MVYRSKTPISMQTAKILEAAQLLHNLTSNEAMKRAADRLSLADKTVQDALHQIEVAKPNAAEGYALFKQMQSALVNRRMVKNEIALMQSIRDGGIERLTHLERISCKAYTPKTDILTG